MKGLTIAFFTCHLSIWVSGQGAMTNQQHLDRIAAEVTQIRNTELQRMKEDSAYTFRGEIKPRFYSREAFNEFFNQYFTLLNYQRQSFTEGNSAAALTTENDTKFNLTLSKKIDRSIISLGTVLNIKDQSGSLFSSEKPASGTLFSATYSILSKKSRFNYWVENTPMNYVGRRAVLDSLYQLYVLQKPIRYPIVKEEVAKLKKKITALEKEIACVLASDHPKKDSVVNVLRKFMLEQTDENAKLSKELSELELSKSFDETVSELKKQSKERLIAKQLGNKGVTSFQLQWFSVGGSYKREVYETYDSLLAFGKRINEKEFNVWTFSVTYNFYFGKTPEWSKTKSPLLGSTYLGFNFAFGTSNNYSAISDSNVTLQTVHSDNDSLYIVATEKKLKNITRKDYDAFNKYRIGVQVTPMFGKGDFVGANLIGGLNFEKSLTTVDLRSGILFHFKDSEKAKSFVNFEIFVNLKDLDNQAKSEKSIWERKEIGIAAIVPFQKVFFK